MTSYDASSPATVTFGEANSDDNGSSLLSRVMSRAPVRGREQTLLYPPTMGAIPPKSCLAPNY
jgi:hypothetical protein